ncbi:transglycosylase SLT domain-containing protein [Streptomyces roseifaciens]
MRLPSISWPALRWVSGIIIWLLLLTGAAAHFAQAQTNRDHYQQIAARLLPDEIQRNCLNILWERESGWNPRAGRTSASYGIPQAYPGHKMASAGPDWRTNPHTQIRWGLSYIRHRYGTPCNALRFWNKNHWY